MAEMNYAGILGKRGTGGTVFQDSETLKIGSDSGKITLVSEGDKFEYPLIITKSSIQEKEKMGINSCFGQDHVMSAGSGLSNISVQGVIFVDMVSPGSILGGIMNKYKNSFSTSAVALGGKYATLTIGSMAYSGMIVSFELSMSAESNAFAMFSCQFLGSSSTGNTSSSSGRKASAGTS